MPVVTITRIAETLGLAHTTVSRALNDHPKISAQTKQRVKEAADRLGYIANSGARQMRDGSTRVVGLVFPDVQNEFFSAAARSMAAHCARSGYQMILGLSEDDPQREEQQVRAMREARVAGVMLAPCASPSAETARLLSRIPAVQFLRRNDALGTTGVYADDRQGIREATRHLLLLRHRRIGYIGPSRTLSTGAQRVEGHDAALRQMDIAVEESLCHFGPARPDTGYEGVKDLLSRPSPPTAIVAGSSRQLLGILRALRESDTEVPQSLSLVAYGDTPWFEACNPAVTAVALPVEQMCETASALLFELIAGTSVPIERTTRLFATTLVVRGTTRRL
ncbi:MAG: LacI family DNA-binding transcriptional regulator [Proteobacteria bacterium]|nr:LacI family DNA-binding transcriptional regulator [Burkholderiales bacterium]